MHVSFARVLLGVLECLCGEQAGHSHDHDLENACTSTTATAQRYEEKGSLFRSTGFSENGTRGSGGSEDDAQDATSHEVAVRVPAAAIRQLKQSVDRLRASHNYMTTERPPSARSSKSVGCSWSPHGLCKQHLSPWTHIPARRNPLPQEMNRVLLVGQEHVRVVDDFLESIAMPVATLENNGRDIAIMPGPPQTGDGIVPTLSSGSNGSQQLQPVLGDDSIDARLRQILDNTLEDDPRPPGLLDRYYTAAQDANLLRDRLSEFEADYAEAFAARSTTLEQDGQVASKDDDDFELHWQREREELSTELADQQATADRLKQRCLDEGLVISIYRDTRGDNEPAPSMPVFTDNLSDFYPAGVEIEHLTYDRYMNVTPPPDERVSDLVDGWLGSSQPQAGSVPVDLARSRAATIDSDTI